MARRRRTRRGFHLTFTILYCVVGGVFALGLGAFVAASRDVETQRTQGVAPDSLVEAPTDIELDLIEGESRYNYRYSVIPGGVYTADELARAIQRDPLVRGEYAHVATAAVRADVLTEPRRAYVSYRVNDQIFWTKNTVALNAGETILSDGETEIRARCGNGISYEPMLPTLDAEPDVTELDELAAEPTPPTSLDNVHTPAPDPWGTADASALAAALPGILGGLAGAGGGPSGSGLPLGTIATGLPTGLLTYDGSDRVEEPPSPVSGGPGDSTVDDAGDPPGTPGPPPGGDPDSPLRPSDPGSPDNPGSPGNPGSPNGPGFPTSPVFPNGPSLPPDPLIPPDPSVPAGPPLFPVNPSDPGDPHDPESPASVPEPATILLLSTGVAATLMRRLRSRRR